MPGEGALAPFRELLQATEGDLVLQRAAAHEGARFDVERQIETVLSQLKEAATTILKIESGCYLSPQETEQGIALARTLLLDKSDPNPTLYWGFVDTILGHSRRIL